MSQKITTRIFGSRADMMQAVGQFMLHYAVSCLPGPEGKGAMADFSIAMTESRDEEKSTYCLTTLLELR